MGSLRLILALSIVFWHMPKHPFVLFNGGIAVEAFFIISGFYMAFVISEKYSRLATPWVATFYLSRILRLAPVYLIVCFVEGLWYLKSNTPNIFSANDLSTQARAALVFINLFVFGQDIWQTILTHAGTNIPNQLIQSTVNFFGANAFEPIYVYIGQAWSLGIELIFYMIAPFVVLSRKRAIALFIACLLVRFYFIEHADLYPNAPWRSRFFPGNLTFFFLGIASYWIYAYAINIKHSKMVGLAFSIAGLGFLIGSVFIAGGVLLFDGPEDYDQFRLWVFYILLTVGIPYLFILTKDTKWDNYIGEISYPVYLVHGFIIGWLSPRLGSSMNSSAKTLAIVFATILVSTALYFFVDRPVERFRHKLAAVRSASHDGIFLGRKAALSLAAVPILIFFLVLFQPYAKIYPPPFLVKVVGHYNIVNFNGQFYGIPQGQSVNWQKDNLETIPGMVIAASAEHVEKSIEAIR